MEGDECGSVTDSMADTAANTAEYRCDICQLNIENKLNFEQHLNGKKHSKMVSQLSGNGGLNESVPATGAMVDMGTKTEKVWCEVCNVWIGNSANLESHLRGRKHAYIAALVQPNKELDKCVPVTDSVVNTATKSAKYRCDICQVNVSSAFTLQQHLNGKKHAITVTQRRGKTAKGNDPAIGSRPATTIVGKPSGQSRLGPVQQNPGIVDFDFQAIQFVTKNKIPYQVRLASCENLCGDIDAYLRHVYPRGKSAVFGSVVTGLACEDSDIDVYFDPHFHGVKKKMSVNEIPRSVETKIVKIVRNIFGSHFPTFQSVLAIPAKVALVKFFHMPTGVNCDLSFKNGIGVCNSILIQFYLSLDPRIRPMVMVLKHWGKIYELTGTGHITNYALVWMVLFYLQQLREPVVPTVAALQSTSYQKHYINQWNCSFDSSIVSWWHTRNNSTIQELLAGFFAFYARFDHELLVICPLLGSVLPKSFFCHVEKLPPEMGILKEKVQRSESLGLRMESRFSLQDPFVLEHNVTFSMSKTLTAKFQSLCLRAESIFSTGPQLRSLFEGCAANNPAKNDVVTEIKISSSKKFGDKLVEAPADSSVEDLKSLWYATVYESLVDIFENVLKLEVRDVSDDGGGTEPKVRRLESHHDVSDGESSSRKDFGSVRMLECSALFCMWDVHKVASKDYVSWKADPSNTSCIQKLTMIEQQKAVTNFTIEHFEKYFGSEQPDGKHPVLSFTCRFVPGQSPIHVVLKFTFDTGDRHIGFVPLMIFLKKHLSKWIEQS